VHHLLHLRKGHFRTHQVDEVIILLIDHYYSDSTQKDRIGNCYTWLKIEPSFSGLRQILFEPKGRICISETHPDTKPPYQVIQSARFLAGGEHFTDATICFSPYLNSVIGGKSTGKSLLAGLIVKASDPEEYKKRKGEQKAGDDLEWIKQKESAVDFEVTWSDGAVSKLNSTTEPRKITYFPQHYLNSKINDKGVGTKELNKIIRVILSQTNTYAEAFTEYESALRRIDADIAAQCSNLESQLRDLRQMKHTTQEKGRSADITVNIEKLKLEFAELNKQFGLTEEDLGIHSALSDLTKTLTDSSAEAASNIEVMASIDKAELLEILAPGEILSQEFETLSEALVAKLTVRLTPVIGTAVEAIGVIVAEELKLEKARQKEIAAKISANNKEHAPILEKIKNSAPLRAKSTQIKNEQAKLGEVVTMEGKIIALEQEIVQTATDLKRYAAVKLESALIVTSKIEAQPFSKGDDQLGIEITSRCKADHIQGILKARIKYQSNPTIRAFLDEDAFADIHTNGYTERVNQIIDQAVAGTIEPKADHKIFTVIQELLSNAIYLNYDLKLGGDSFVIMSPGKRALALLRVLVELDTSQHPIILDQPEDDLDNRSIYEGLATYIKAKKDHRQIIVVTHNPNVVVGADSEYVIVANQSGQESNQDNRRYRFEYVYGGLENSFLDDSTQYVLEKQGVREHVCEILDGGEAAFVRREQLYSGRKKRKWIN
jgi:predicted ATPase